MDAELEKLVEAGKLTTKSADQLEKLKPGTFCLHKSWGFGRVREWNLLLNQIVIDFATKKSHPMQAQYAAENLTALAQEHFLVRKATDIASIKNLTREDPVALVQNILESLDGKASEQQIGEWLIGDIFTEAEWKRWWESTRKALKASGAFSIPARKTDPIEIRGEGVSHADELLTAFNKARQPNQQIAAVEQIIKSCEQFKEPEKQLQPIVVAIENATVRNQKLHPELAFQLIIARDDLLARVPSLHTTHVGLTLSKAIVEKEKRLTSILPNLPAAKEKRVLQALPAALGAGWTERALRLMEASHGRMVAQIPRILNEAGQHAELRTMLERSIREHSATSEMLIWLCSEKKDWGDLITPDLLWAILAALEREQHSSTGRGSKLQRAVVDDRELLGEMFKKVDVGLARDAMRRLQLTPLFDELTKRSLLARMVKVYPELESMIAGAEPQRPPQRRLPTMIAHVAEPQPHTEMRQRQREVAGVGRDPVRAANGERALDHGQPRSRQRRHHARPAREPALGLVDDGVLESHRAPPHIWPQTPAEPFGGICVLPVGRSGSPNAPIG